MVSSNKPSVLSCSHNRLTETNHLDICEKGLGYRPSHNETACIVVHESVFAYGSRPSAELRESGFWQKMLLETDVAGPPKREEVPRAVEPPTVEEGVRKPIPRGANPGCGEDGVHAPQINFGSMPPLEPKWLRATSD